MNGWCRSCVLGIVALCGESGATAVLSRTCVATVLCALACVISRPVPPLAGEQCINFDESRHRHCRHRCSPPPPSSDAFQPCTTTMTTTASPAVYTAASTFSSLSCAPPSCGVLIACATIVPCGCPQHPSQQWRGGGCACSCCWFFACRPPGIALRRYRVHAAAAAAAVPLAIIMVIILLVVVMMMVVCRSSARKPPSLTR